MVITLDDYAEIRRLFNSGISKRAIAKKLGTSKNTVDKYCQGDTAPWNRKKYSRQSTIISDDVMEFIRQCLEEDEREGVRTQKHTAKRIFNRLVDECNFTGGESTVRRTVNQLREKVQKPFIPLEFSPGEALQIDWGIAKIYLDGHKMDVNLFCAGLCTSDAPIVFAFEKQNEESFLEALVRAFQHFGGVARRVFFENAKVAC
ncbi:MAG: helix-turn-helix domain-containing protein [Negativicutes bacterium]|nr:helix-turn-helix domain-containing protein [Negativicutes bacterium]